jgi:dTDP-4-amino-4,6-dideoxygalactose transaminase
VSTADLLRWVRLGASQRSSSALLREAVAARFGIRHAFVTSTGRAGLTILLRALRTLAPPGRDEVVLPSYTCFSVAASVVKAGLRPRIVDIDPATLDYDPARLREADVTGVLAIVATSLYGLPSNLPFLAALARQQGVFLIDDAAQAMGAMVGGQLSGTWGDAGLFSLDKGKNVSAIDGGIVVTNSDDIARAVTAQVEQLPAPHATETAAGVLKALVYSVALHPRLYWIPNGIPQLGLGRTVFTTDFPLEAATPALAALGAVMLRRLEEFTEVRTTNAASFLNALRDISGVRTITPVPGSLPVYLRLPILIPDADSRQSVFAALKAIGIGATGSYPSSLADVPALQAVGIAGAHADGGRYVADHIVTLPTHAFVTAADVKRIINVLAETLCGDSISSACAESV